MALSTPITKLFGIKHPVLLAGMNQAAGPSLAAAVTNAGGLGTIGGVTFTPRFLQEAIDELKAELNDKNAPFGIDLLLPQVGGNARKTNKDYTQGKLDELIDIVIQNKAALFVSAVGVPPKHAVDKLHKAGIPVMNMCGHPKHIPKALEVGVDIICCQGGEGGGHTGDVPTSILIPKAVEMCVGKKSPLTGEQVMVIAAGGIYNGQGLAAALAMGAAGVWVGTRFICAEEAGAPKSHQNAVLTAGYEDTIRSIIFTGRPLRIRKTPYVENWEVNRKQEMKELAAKGVLPYTVDPEDVENRPHLMGKVAAVVNEIKPAKFIVEEMVAEAVQYLKQASSYVQTSSKL